MIVDDWQTAFRWKREELERAIKRAEDAAIGRALRGCTPDVRDINRLRYLKSELALLNDIERKAVQRAEQLDNEVL